MISFECDYNNGACQQVIDNLIKYNTAKPTPYGFDEFSDRAKQRIREACGLPDAQIFFLTGGTQANATTIDSMLYQYEGVICVGTGHYHSRYGWENGSEGAQQVSRRLYARRQ